MNRVIYLNERPTDLTQHDVILKGQFVIAAKTAGIGFGADAWEKITPIRQGRRTIPLPEGLIACPGTKKVSSPDYRALVKTSLWDLVDFGKTYQELSRRLEPRHVEVWETVAIQFTGDDSPASPSAGVVRPDRPLFTPSRKWVAS